MQQREIDEYLDTLGEDPGHQLINLMRKHAFIPSELGPVFS
jgi:hypothetical protein